MKICGSTSQKELAENTNLKNKASTTRNRTFDIARGIAMLCIIAGHLKSLSILTRIVFTFHVPVFFFISGYFFREGGNLRKTIIKLIKPYFFTSAVLMFIDCGRAIMKGMKGLQIDTVGQVLYNRFIGMLYGSGSRTDFLGHSFPTTGAIWFLLALIWCELLFTAMLNLTKGKRFRNIMLYLISFILWLVAYITAKETWLPLSIQSGFSAILFMTIGYQCKRNNIFINYRGKISIVLLCGVMWLVSLFFSITNDHMSIVRSAFPNPPTNIFGALSAIWILLFVGDKLSKKVDLSSGSKVRNNLAKALAFVGENSLIILSFHTIEQSLPVGGVLKYLPGACGYALIFVIWVLICVIGVGICHKFDFLKWVFSISR